MQIPGLFPESDPVIYNWDLGMFLFFTKFPK